MSEFDFLLRTLTKGDCSLLLDVENLRINPPITATTQRSALRALPRDRSRSARRWRDAVEGLQVDSHDRPISAEPGLLKDSSASAAGKRHRRARSRGRRRAARSSRTSQVRAVVEPYGDLTREELLALKNALFTGSLVKDCSRNRPRTARIRPRSRESKTDRQGRIRLGRGRAGPRRAVFAAGKRLRDRPPGQGLFEAERMGSHSIRSSAGAARSPVCSTSPIASLRSPRCGQCPGRATRPGRVEAKYQMVVLFRRALGVRLRACRFNVRAFFESDGTETPTNNPGNANASRHHRRPAQRCSAHDPAFSKLIRFPACSPVLEGAA